MQAEFLIWGLSNKIGLSHQLKMIFLNVTAEKIDESRLKTTAE